jgi:hypothetical protein
LVNHLENSLKLKANQILEKFAKFIIMQLILLRWMITIKNDIIKKVNTAGNNDSKEPDMGDNNNNDNGNDNEGGSNDNNDPRRMYKKMMIYS